MLSGRPSLHQMRSIRLRSIFHDVRLERTYVHHAYGFDLLASETPRRLTIRWISGSQLYERLGEIVECTALEYALLFGGPRERRTVTLLRERGAIECRIHRLVQIRAHRLAIRGKCLNSWRELLSNGSGAWCNLSVHASVDPPGWAVLC